MLNRMREKSRTRRSVMTLHAEEEMEEDGWIIYGDESVILRGEIIEQQRDRKAGNANI